MNLKGKNNPNYKHGRYCNPNFCTDCGKIIDKSGRSKRCPKCRSLFNNPFKGKKHSKYTKKIIGIKSKEKFTKDFVEKIHKLHDGHKTNMNGYISVRKFNHPDKNYNGCVLEHRLVMEKKLGRRLTKIEKVHHKDFQRNHNAKSNLYIYKNTSEHMKGHATLHKLVPILLKNKIIKFFKGKYILGVI
jgi:hypothetical protein